MVGSSVFRKRSFDVQPLPGISVPKGRMGGRGDRRSLAHRKVAAPG